MLVAPEDLTEAEAAVWGLVAPHVVAPEAAELVRLWCSSVVELRAAEAWVRENGTTIAIRDDKGNLKSVAQAPKYVQVRALRSDLVKLADALRLSPRARASAVSASVSAGSGVSPLDELTRRRSARRTGAAGSAPS